MKSFGFTAMINRDLYNEGNINYSSFIKNKNIACYAHFLEKFTDDKIFKENDSYLLLLDGVVLNKKQLMTTAKVSDWFSYLTMQYEEKGNTFFDELRGSFCGLLVDKPKRCSILFTDHIGSKFIYYTRQDNTFACSTMIANLYKFRHANHLKCTLSEQGAIMLLTYGFMLENYTLCEEVKKVQPGCYVIFENGQITEHRYCMLDNTPDYSITLSDAIDLYDQEFRRAVALEFEKDKEYGYHHMVALSGGLDCRMTSWVAHEMGYTDQLNITFSQTDYWDEIVSKQIATYLKHEWLFKALDNGLWLYNLDNVLEITGGNVLYYGQAHGMSLYKYLNFEDFGILHSGQLGGGQEKGESFSYGDGAYSTKYLHLLDIKQLEKYPNKEIGMYYCRYFNGTMQGQIPVYAYLETTAPFIDWDALSRISKVPISMRYAGIDTLQNKWIIAKYPKAADFVWESIKSKITEPTITIAGRTRTIRQCREAIKNKLHFGKNGNCSKMHMNPIEYYLQTNFELRDFINDKLLDVDCIENKTVRDIVIEIMTKGSYMEKIQAVTLVRTIRLLGIE
ncbi:MAG: hypothetical protein E6554_06100 [Bacteroides sp.]|jgi:asparagine synthase|nr:hypothetical protein [Bacteroides sp.]